MIPNFFETTNTYRHATLYGQQHTCMHALKGVHNPLVTWDQVNKYIKYKLKTWREKIEFVGIDGHNLILEHCGGELTPILGLNNQINGLHSILVYFSPRRVMIWIWDLNVGRRWKIYLSKRYRKVHEQQSRKTSLN